MVSHPRECESLKGGVSTLNGDFRKCFAVDAALLVVGVVLSGGCNCSDTHHTPFLLLVASRLQWKGEKGQTDCTSVKLQDPEMGLSSGYFVRLELIKGES